MIGQHVHARRERSVRLRSGAAVHLRAIRPEDEDRLIALYGRLSPESARQRFFTGMKWLPRAWARLRQRRLSRSARDVMEQTTEQGVTELRVRPHPHAMEDTA